MQLIVKCYQLHKQQIDKEWFDISLKIVNEYAISYICMIKLEQSFFYNHF